MTPDRLATVVAREPEEAKHVPIAVWDAMRDPGIAEVAVIGEDGTLVGLGDYLRAMEARILAAVREAR